MFSLTHRLVSKRRPLIVLSLTALLLFHLWNVTHQPEDDGHIQRQLNKSGNDSFWQKALPSSVLDHYRTPDRPLPDTDLESLIVGHNNNQQSAQQDKNTHTDTENQQQQQQFQSRLPHIQFDFGPEPEAYTLLREQRQNAVKSAFLHGWSGYKTYAMGHDELKPLSNGTSNPFAHWGATLIDSLSTMTIMGLEEEFQAALTEVEKVKFNLDNGNNIIVFEAIIRYMGGLLSAYELSGQQHDILLQKAHQLGKTLSASFDTPTGLFPHQWNPSSNTPDKGVLVADLSMQLELFTLSYHTKDWTFAKKAQGITNFMDKMDSKSGLHIPGLYPTGINIVTGKFTDAVCRLGAMGDSWFEYLLKQYLLVDGSMSQYSRMYLESVDAMKKYVLSFIPGNDMIFVPPFDTQSKSRHITMDHLSCFVPGMLALGSKTFNRPEDLTIATGTLEACMHLYRTSDTGLGAEMWSFTGGQTYDRLSYQETIDQLGNNRNPKHHEPNYRLPARPERFDKVRVIDAKYHLRPETLESLYVLYRITGDQKYQEYGWEIFTAIEKHCKTASGYASINNVDRDTASFGQAAQNQIDTMESFLFAETFKYLYLLFSPPDTISLDHYVFNTEGHPLRRRRWNRKD